MSKWDQLKSEYIEWVLLDRHQRAVSNLPASDTEWAAAKDISDRTLRNWKSDPEIAARIETRQKEQALRLPGATLSGPTSFGVANTDEPESEYQLIKTKLLQMAAAGDKSALDTYFRTYGKSYVEEETAARKSDFRELDTGELYRRALALIPDDLLEEELRIRKGINNDN
jgi:hypothetical protein